MLFVGYNTLLVWIWPQWGCSQSRTHTRQLLYHRVHFNKFISFITIVCGIGRITQVQIRGQDCGVAFRPEDQILILDL